jgi:hypothetical protein
MVDVNGAAQLLWIEHPLPDAANTPLIHQCSST